VSLFLTLFLTNAMPAQLAGVQIPDSATVGGKSIVLNGIGLREKYFIDVYVGALYMPARTSNAQQAINQDVPKRIVMHFIYKEVTAEQLNEVWHDGFASAPNGSAMKAQLNKLCSWMATVRTGDSIILDYVPGTGTTVTVKGAKKGTIAGTDFMKALWSVYLGPVPPTEKLKKGMLGR
jgi:hypothetical protein